MEKGFIRAGHNTPVGPSL